MNFPIPSEVQAPTCPLITDQSVLKAIGNTPLIRIHNLGKEFKDVDIYAKAEWKNAGFNDVDYVVDVLDMAIESGQRLGVPATSINDLKEIKYSLYKGGT